VADELGSLVQQAMASLDRAIATGLSELVTTRAVDPCPRCGRLMVEFPTPEMIASRETSLTTNDDWIAFRQRVLFGPEVDRRHRRACRGRRNPHCSNCGDERGGQFGHETSECTYDSKAAQ